MEYGAGGEERFGVGLGTAYHQAAAEPVIDHRVLQSGRRLIGFVLRLAAAVA